MTMSSATPLADYVTSDFNGDGVSDVLWQNTNGTTGVWYLSASGGYTATIFGQPDPSWKPAAIGDFNADGKADILWRNSNGAVGEWVSNGNNPFSEGLLGNVDPSWVIQGTGDYNGDGTSDTLWRNTSTGDVGIWYMISTGGYVPVDLGAVDPSWTIQGIGDFNAAGKSGILWRNTNGEVGVWLNSPGAGAASFTKVDLGNAPTDWVIQGVGDFNGDGTSDILWRNTTTGDLGIWFMNATGGYTSQIVSTGIDSSFAVQAVGQYNATGKAGILWRRTTTGDVSEWVSTQAGGGFTGFKVEGLLNAVDPSWQVVGEQPSAVTPQGTHVPAAMAQAMAAMNASGSGHALAHAATTPQATTHPMLAAPALAMA